MLPRLRALWERIETSLWFIPILMTVAAILLAALMLQLPGEPASVHSAWWLHAGSASDASDLLQTLLGSLITMATLAVSITIVVLTLAAGQLGPRLILSFMGDWRTQTSLGLFLSTIVYLLLVLRPLHKDMPAGSVPHVAVTVGTGLVLLCIVVLLFFVHHLARSIVSDTVIERVGAALDQAVDENLPAGDDGARDAADAVAGTPLSTPICLPRGGYIQIIDFDALVTVAAAHQAVITLNYRPGHHVLAGGVHGSVSPPSAMTPALERAVAASVAIGGERTAVQDLEFSIRQLVEIALRALSPGINDPYTALAVIDRLGVSLARIIGRGPAQRIWRDDRGIVRVVAPVSTFDGMIDTAFAQIRQAGEDYPAILIHLLETLAQLAEISRTDEQREVIAVHVGMIGEAGRRTIAEPHDREALERRRAHALACLGRGAAHASRTSALPAMPAAR